MFLHYERILIVDIANWLLDRYQVLRDGMYKETG